jgi:NADH-quinone oxidoreductase subunit F
MIEKTGVKIHLNVEIGKSLTFDQLKKQHDAVYLAIGTQSSKKAGIPGEQLAGVYDGLNFLRQVSLGKNPPVGKTVVVIGGGNVAVDAALTSLRMGAQKVTIVCLEQRDEMPAIEEDIREALEDGVKLINGFGPKKISGEEKVNGVEFVRCTRVFDDKGGFSPAYDVCETALVEAHTVITAIGQTPDLSFAKDLSGQGRVATDPTTRMTSLEGVFAGGDLVRGSNVAIAAIADGKEAARAMDIYLGGKGILNTGIEVNIPAPDLTVRPYLGDRHPLERLSQSERICTFAEVAKGYCRDNAVGEAKRCFRCDQQLREQADPDKCMGCGLCVTTCPGEAITLKERESYVEPVTTLQDLITKYLRL